jgi:hypothetical protein
MRRDVMGVVEPAGVVVVVVVVEVEEAVERRRRGKGEKGRRDPVIALIVTVGGPGLGRGSTP